MELNLVCTGGVGCGVLARVGKMLYLREQIKMSHQDYIISHCRPILYIPSFRIQDCLSFPENTDPMFPSQAWSHPSSEVGREAAQLRGVEWVHG